ncbi:MAG: NAD(P)H-binding protein [Gammaproteobacteria bacterium]|nr:NAD(P)H-binding protein [Gammaproteobacteria bacterium]
MARLTLLLVLSALFGCQSTAETSPEPAPQPLHVLVYGASGNIGRHIVDEALARGHLVTGVTRDPSRIKRRHPGFSVVQGDILEPNSIRSLIADRDIIVISVRGILGNSEDPEDAVALRGLRAVVETVRESGKAGPRVLHVGGAGTLELASGQLLADALPGVFMNRELRTEIAAQVRALDYLRGVDDVAWTYITPPKVLSERKRTGRYRIGGDRMLEDERGASAISRADFAVAVVDEAERGRFIRQRFSVAR